ncbi:MEKHLA domain-containing protein [Tardiphaga sp. 20_F10_N6_6]|uniref:MEKHLA domain-containing protein n=1 Tax=Tardiphaga sp. 20_F10_N6_6 TaxID=3240788 RepID=UPI003F88D2E5
MSFYVEAQLGRARDPDFFRLLEVSFERVVGRPLVENGRNAAWLYNQAPFAVLAHDDQLDPVFIYANRVAQACFEYSWEEFIGLPSRLSAEETNREERKRIMHAVSRSGVITNYSGVRISKSGRRFCIENGTVWQLVDEKGRGQGQAAIFTRWHDIRKR